jgi:hypothetical protein
LVRGKLGACIGQVHLEPGNWQVHFVGVQGVRWDKGGTVRTHDYNFFYGKGKENHQFTTENFVHNRIV